jgi:GTP-binding protein YchF
VNFTLFGYPKTGKSTLFNILTGAHARVSAFEAGKREAHERLTPIPDPRLDRLAALYPDKKKVVAAAEIVDLAGISYGEVKTSVFLNALRKADALVHVVRGFHDEDIPHPKNRISPDDDIRTMEEELVLADLLSIEARLERLDKDLKKMKSPEAERERETLLRLKTHLDGGRPARDFAFPGDEEKTLRAFAFLSQKPILHLVNADEADAGRLAEIEQSAGARGTRSAALACCGKIEGEILEVENEEEKRVFCAAYGLSELTAPRFFPLMMALLEEIFFYTIGKEEVRAWPVRRSTPAAKAAGAIHTDIEHGFIRAEVIGFEDLLAQGSWQHAKDKGHIRLEGKDYVVQDGDVIFFRFAT